MAWQEAVDLSKFTVSAASFGGPIGKYESFTKGSTVVFIIKKLMIKK